MSKETRIGIFAFIAIATLIVGYQYLKGINVFGSSNMYYALYDNVDQLNTSDPVYLNGVQVGSVQEITFNPQNVNEIKVGFNLMSGLSLPKQTVASIASSSLMGGKMVTLQSTGGCTGSDCLQSGDFMIGNVQGMFDAILGSSGGDEGGGPADMIKNNLGDIVDTLAYSLSDPNSEHAIGQSFKRLEGILANLEKTSLQLDKLMARSSRKLDGTLGNVQSITGNIESNNADLTQMIQNMSSFSKNLKEADVAGLMDQAKATMLTTDKSVAALQGTLASAEESMKNLTKTLDAVNNGKGTLGKMMNEDELYDNMLLTTKNLELLLQDFRLNPKRYVNVSVFGKKQKKYEVPEGDPAFEEGEN